MLYVLCVKHKKRFAGVDSLFKIQLVRFQHAKATTFAGLLNQYGLISTQKLPGGAKTGQPYHPGPDFLPDPLCP